MTAGAQPRLRADARRNRDRILVTAAAAFADDGPDVPMEEIARLAGVGVGTLYRRFPDREALLVAVVQDSMARALGRTRAAAAEATPGQAWDALVRSLSSPRELRLMMSLTSLASPTTAAAVHADPTTRRIRQEYAEVLDGLVRAAQAEGTLRPDVGAGDVAHLLSLVAYGLRRTPDATAEIAFERARAIVLDGLRARPRTPLPGRPLTTTDLEAE
ncbi:helix-turn-helix transcriptional regulator [Frankia sp. CNm7]|uniref:Helix-turn-helix transcriptional regulator n=1 Tax=Frankia nepalensis TaxID=1836974 RepID=A0A937RMC1_9ACTN|nr:TetR/AcrR family transcriptional regulator [Frankia nepalensis]MBL7500037.1 helix-turn-helix transcriptional regulator [Frankia nepalensis]MBL7511534.1 helix-turn-helix transcriptional regulator [Frankia nepalensis]MBL7519249.1 helix-turn-helix transcriptional regulator [Frankia nepalensis]MBL7628526.1 helix-turn-helix transcriptional regulator [Frankia nepalensis]